MSACDCYELDYDDHYRKDCPVTCNYCQGSKTEGWHDCSQAQIAKRRLESVVGEIHQTMQTPGWKLPTSIQMEHHADALHLMATNAALSGLQLKSEYIYNEDMTNGR